MAFSEQCSAGSHEAVRCGAGSARRRRTQSEQCVLQVGEAHRPQAFRVILGGAAACGGGTGRLSTTVLRVRRGGCCPNTAPRCSGS